MYIKFHSSTVKNQEKSVILEGKIDEASVIFYELSDYQNNFYKAIRLLEKFN